MTFVDDKVKALPEKNRRDFEETLEAIKVDGFSRPNSWLNLRDFKEGYSPDMVKLVLYMEMYENDFSRLHNSGGESD